MAIERQTVILPKHFFLGLLLSALFVGSHAELPAQTGLTTTNYNDLDEVFRDTYLKNPNAAKKLFYEAFIEAQELLLSGKLTQAKESISRLHKIKPMNRYEESRLYLIDYWYFEKIGDKENETEALKKLMPIAYGNIDFNVFIEAGIRLLKRQYNSQDYGGAIETLNQLRKDTRSESKLKPITPAISKLDDINNSTQDIFQQIKVDINGKWGTTLLRSIFYLDNINGEVSTIEFNCENKIATFNYKQNTILSIPAKWGKCAIKINASPNTTFGFSQITKKYSE